MDEGGDYRKWDELIPDALGIIFKNLSLLEVLTIVPSVCKSWGKVVMGPCCWQEIDIKEWSKYRKPEIIDRMLELLISRSGGSARLLSVSGLRSDQSILFLATHAQSLQTLRLLRCDIHDSVIETMSGKLTALTTLDLSYCITIGAQALKAIGKNCRFLTTLRRVMRPLEVVHMHSQEDEALAISATMPRLQHLQIAYLLVTPSSVIEILKNCKHLKLLDIRGCWNVKLDEKFVKGFGNLEVMGPAVGDYWDSTSDYSGHSGYLGSAFDDDDDDDDDNDVGDDDDDDDGDDDDDDGDYNDIDYDFGMSYDFDYEYDDCKYYVYD
ncbi:hypothetical protein OROMI_019166 [Orobanche minor]